MIVLIDVTEEDIAKGERHRCKQCPVALAIRRISSAAEVSVGNSCVDFYSHIRRPLASLSLPVVARLFIKCFDGNMIPDPFTFPLDIPAELLRENHEGKL